MDGASKMKKQGVMMKKHQEEFVVWAVSRGSLLSSESLKRTRAIVTQVTGDKKIKIYVLPIEEIPWIQKIKNWFTGLFSWNGRFLGNLESYLVEASEEKINLLRSEFDQIKKAGESEIYVFSDQIRKAKFVFSSPEDAKILKISDLSLVTLPVDLSLQRVPYESQRDESKSSFHHPDFNRTLLLLVDPEVSEHTFYAALNYAKSKKSSLSLYFFSSSGEGSMKSVLLGCEASFRAYRDEQRALIMRDWYRAAAHAGVPIRVLDYFDSLGFHESFMKKIKSEEFEMVVIEHSIIIDFFWRGAIEKITSICPVPVWLATPWSLRDNQNEDQKLFQKPIQRYDNQRLRSLPSMDPSKIHSLEQKLEQKLAERQDRDIAI